MVAFFWVFLPLVDFLTRADKPGASSFSSFPTQGFAYFLPCIGMLAVGSLSLLALSPWWALVWEQAHSPTIYLSKTNLVNGNFPKDVHLKIHIYIMQWILCCTCYNECLHPFRNILIRIVYFWAFQVFLDSEMLHLWILHYVIWNSSNAFLLVSGVHFAV